MRIIIAIIAFTSFISVRAQTLLPGSSLHYMQQDPFNHYSLLNDSNHVQKKWSVSSYAGFAAGIGFFNGGNAAFFPAQIGLRLNRRLTNNLYAFAGVTAALAFFNFNRSFNTADLRNNYMAVPGFNASGIYSGIQAGLMYVNDAKTFSISGSIGVGRSYPFYPSSRVNTQKQSSFIGSRQ